MGIYLDQYLNPHNYKTRNFNKTNSIIYQLYEVATSTKNNPTAYYRKNYDSIPPWILLSNLTLGQTRMLFSIFKSDCTKYVALSLLPHEAFGSSFDDLLINFLTDKEWKQLESFPDTSKEGLAFEKKLLSKKKEPYIEMVKTMLHIIHYFRNQLAHGNKLLHFKTPFKLRLKTLRTYADSDVFNDKEFYKKDLGKNDLFAFMISLIILLDKYDSIYMLDQLKSWKERNTKNKEAQQAFDNFLRSCDLPVDFINRLSKLKIDPLYQDNLNKRFN